MHQHVNWATKVNFGLTSCAVNRQNDYISIKIIYNGNVTDKK